MLLSIFLCECTSANDNQLGQIVVPDYQKLRQKIQKLKNEFGHFLLHEPQVGR